MGVDHLPDQAAHLLEQIRIAGPQLLDQPGGSFDVAEEEGDLARGEIGSLIGTGRFPKLAFCGGS